MSAYVLNEAASVSPPVLAGDRVVTVRTRIIDAPARVPWRDIAHLVTVTAGQATVRLLDRAGTAMLDSDQKVDQFRAEYQACMYLASQLHFDLGVEVHDCESKDAYCQRRAASSVATDTRDDAERAAQEGVKQ